MVRSDSASSAIVLGLRMVQEVGARHGFPSVRAGLNTGPAVARDGDWFGGAVNLAARVSGAAAGGEVLLTAAPVAAARSEADGELGSADPERGILLKARGQRSLRNVGAPVDLFEACYEHPRGAQGFEFDPVCRMAVDPGSAAGRLRCRAHEFYFCSLSCAEAFAADPDHYSRVVGTASSAERSR
jgi:adenylate cyclase